MNERFTRSVSLSLLAFALCAPICASAASDAGDVDVPPGLVLQNAAPPPSLAPIVAAPVAIADLAPADRYFGPLKMSLLGMRNELRDLRAAYALHPERTDAVLGMAHRTEESLRDMEAQYPRDTALPRLVYGLQRLYAEIRTDEAQAKAKATADWMFAKYGASAQAADLRRDAAVATDLAASPSSLVPDASPAR